MCESTLLTTAEMPNSVSPTSNEILYSMFASQVSTTPSQVAVTYDDGKSVTRYTYNDVHLMSSEISRVLQSVNAEKTVVGYLGIANGFSPSVIIGILKASAAFAVISMRLPIDYNTHFIKKLGMKWIISDQKIPINKLGWDVRHNRDITLNNHMLYLLEVTDVPSIMYEYANEWKLAYAIQTSGTTGRPKVVKVPQSCIIPNIVDFREKFAISVNDLVFMAAPLTFDPSVVEIFAALTSGAGLLVVPEVIKSIPQKLVETLCFRHKVTIMQATPSLIKRIGAERLKRSLFSSSSSLRVMGFGGEPCPNISTLRQWQEDGNATCFYNLYGITEVSSWATLQCIHLEGTETDVSLGEPLSGTELEIIDESGRLTLEGEGQLFVGGKNRVCFLDDEVPVKSDCKVMRPTGDWVKVGPDGQLIFIGRRDDEVKRCGKKFALTAVETVMLSCSSVENCCCVYDVELQKLWLFVVATAGSLTPVQTDEIRCHLRLHLPDHAIPDDILAIQLLPVTSNGKVDRKLLLRCIQNGDYSEKVELCLAKLRQLCEEEWKNLINVGVVQDDDNFILSGGDSIRAIQYVQSLTVFSGHALPLCTDKLLHETFETVWKYVAQCVTQKSNRKRTVMPVTESDEPLLKQSATDAKTLKLNEDFPVVVSRANHILAAHSEDITETGIDSEIKLCCITNPLRLSWRYDLGKCVDASPVIVCRYPFYVHVLVGKLYLCTEEIKISYLPNRTGKSIPTVYIGSHSHAVAAIDIKSGAEIWRSVLGGRIESSAAATLCGKYVIVGCYDRNVYCLRSKDGTIKWKYATGAEVKCSPCVVPSIGLVYFGGHDHWLYALRIQSGTCAWKVQPSKGSIFSSPCYSAVADLIYAGTLDGSFCALSPVSGNIVWQNFYNHPIFSSPSVSDSCLCFGCVDGFVYCVDHKGDEMWKCTTGGPVFSSPCIYKDTATNEELVFCGSHSQRLSCWRLRDGTTLWKLDVDAPIYASPFAVSVLGTNNKKDMMSSDDRGLRTALVFVTTNGKLRIVMVDDGTQIITTYQFPSEVFSSPVVVGHSVIVGCRDNYVYCLDLKSA